MSAYWMLAQRVDELEAKLAGVMKREVQLEAQVHRMELERQSSIDEAHKRGVKEGWNRKKSFDAQTRRRDE